MADRTSWGLIRCMVSEDTRGPLVPPSSIQPFPGEHIPTASFPALREAQAAKRKSNREDSFTAIAVYQFSMLVEPDVTCQSSRTKIVEKIHAMLQ